jgi:HK97 family phage major capsid protein
VSEPNEIEERLGTQLKELEDRQSDLSERIEAASEKDDRKAVDELTTKLNEHEEAIKDVLAEKERVEFEAERKAMKSRVESLEQSIAKAREPMADFSPTTGGGDSKAVYEDRSFWSDVQAAAKSGYSGEAFDRWTESVGEKAMTQGTGSAGGFLVPDQVSADVLDLRSQRAVLRSLIPTVQVDSDTLRIASVTGGLTAGWVAELATKPSQDMTFGEISTNVFTVAGLAVVSNQLLRNSNPSIDRLVNRDLALRIGNVEEIAIIAGSGTGQPQGILNTSGVNTVALTSTAVLDLLDAIVDAITAIYTNYFGGPNAIVMHPRTWARLVKARESATSASYIVGAPSGAQPRRSNSDVPGYSGGQVPRGDLFGVPVYTTANVPTNLGGTTNESRVIVGNFDEALLLENQGLTLDRSEHVYFTTNQTVFRAEQAEGFTAARYPKAFTVIAGAGLANG